MPPGREREAYLQAACGDDATLRARVDALLAADAPTQDPAAGHADLPGESAGDQIGHYKLLQSIGEGGFGTVWMAEQREPVRRRVALKIIKLGMDTRQVIARFEVERQALALMDHPHIAKVLDAGATATGRPYFVMELVKGVPIVEYCDTQQLDTRARLRLFVQVCRAIQHAHNKGIIHRDIKPSNVLVTLHDGAPEPKVIDFGIAKATSADLTAKTQFTEHRQLLGTPAYMSPEQAETTGLDIDTRADVYSLGILLYELLTGTTPFDTRTLLASGYQAMLQAIREVEPQRPSTRISTLGQTAARTAQSRQTDVKRLGQLLRGDLDWIVLKCLEKDRLRRYETADALAEDIRRHLEHEPVRVGPPGVGYRLRKFARRNLAAVLAGAAIFVLLACGVIGTAWGLVRALDEKTRADAAAQSAMRSAHAESQARQEAQISAERAERELARATEVKRLITEMLDGVDPETAKGADTTLLKGILDETAARLTRGEVTDELVAAELREVIGGVYGRLGMHAEAERHLGQVVEIRRRILGAEDILSVQAASKIAAMHWRQGRFADAVKEAREIVAATTRVLGPEHALSLRAASALAGYLIEHGSYDEAESLVQRIIERAGVLETRLGALNDLGWLYQIRGRYFDAERTFVKLLDIARRQLPAGHRSSRYASFNLACVYLELSRFAEAESLLQQALETDRQYFGEDHPETIEDRLQLGNLCRELDRCVEAQRSLEATLDVSRRIQGEQHKITAEIMVALAGVHRRAGRFDEAAPLYLAAHDIQRRALGEQHLSTQLTRLQQAILERVRGRYLEAEPLLDAAVAGLRAGSSEDHLGTRVAQMNLVELYVATARHDQATAALAQLLPAIRRTLGARHVLMGRALRARIRLALARGDGVAARSSCEELLAHLGDRGSVEPPTPTSLWLEAWVRTRDVPAVRDPAQAMSLARRASDMEEANGGGELWILLDTLALAQRLQGDNTGAVATERRALGLVPAGHPERTELERRLAEYEAAHRGGGAAPGADRR